MLSEKEKKEMLEDAHNPMIKNAFQEAERKYLDWLKKHPGYKSLDNYITFLNSIQKIFGPFPVRKSALPSLHNFRL